MQNIPTAFAKAFAQLRDPPIIRLLVKSILITLAIFGLLGAGLWYGLYLNLLDQGVALGAEIGAIIAVIIVIVGGWLLFRIVALAVVQFFADEVVLAVEQRHYPDHAGKARTLGFAQEARNSARSAGRALLVNGLALLVAIPLFFTAIGPAIVFWAANAWLLGRELQDIVWLRHKSGPDDRAPLGAIERFVLGGIVTAMLAIPFVNLLAPVIGTASAAHLVHGKLSGIRHAS